MLLVNNLLLLHLDLDPTQLEGMVYYLTARMAMEIGMTMKMLMRIYSPPSKQSGTRQRKYVKMWIVIFSPTGTKELLQVLGVPLDQQTSRVIPSSSTWLSTGGEPIVYTVHPRSSPHSSASTSEDSAGTIPFTVNTQQPPQDYKVEGERRQRVDDGDDGPSDRRVGGERMINFRRNSDRPLDGSSHPTILGGLANDGRDRGTSEKGTEEKKDPTITGGGGGGSTGGRETERSETAAAAEQQQKQQQQEKKGTNEVEEEVDLAIYLATIGPTTRDHMIDTHGVHPHVVAPRPSPEGVAGV